jgi:hypothetical protein
MFEPIKYENRDPNPEFDDDRKKEADKFYELHLECQILAEWFDALAANPPPWYPAETQLQDWAIVERMHELKDRPDLRLDYMLKGFAESLPIKTTRAWPIDTQSDNLNQIRENGERHAVDQVRMFDYKSQMSHTDRVVRFNKLVARINWGDDSPPTKAFIAMVLQSGMQIERKYTEESGRITFHKPPLTYLGLLESIPMKDYLEAIGQDKVIAIFMALRKCQSKDKCLSPEQEIEIVSIEWLVNHLPTASFRPVFDTIRRELGFPELKKPEAAKPDEPLAEGWQAPATEEHKPGEVDSPKAP